MHFRERHFCIFIKISLKFVSDDPIDNELSIGVDKGLVPNRRQGIIWTNIDPIHWRLYAALGRDELKTYHVTLDHPVARQHYPWGNQWQKHEVCNDLNRSKVFRWRVDALGVVCYETSSNNSIAFVRSIWIFLKIIYIANANWNRWRAWQKHLGTCSHVWFIFLYFRHSWIIKRIF